ncbi:glycosyltransferase [Rhodospira trueperi]|uniref:Glycosyltransferase involved in cell wall bisynthesis n=1 Tax=Rhodospira trueperi TaxID=69960 RepID=A0A1G6YQ39_9PROT|nr:glycosyltransferase [Rhodospira trueperi]SDD92431.1 Glycosyltransferase involved in cell wall bisynthesis [Rhodospira trueperi]
MRPADEKGDLFEGRPAQPRRRGEAAEPRAPEGGCGEKTKDSTLPGRCRDAEPEDSILSSASPNTILFVANALDNFVHHRRNVVEAAAGAGFRPVVFAVGSDRETDTTGFEYRPIRLERHRFALGRDAGLFLTVLRFLLTEKPAAVHFINIKPYLYGGLAVRVARLFGWRGRTVVTVPGLGRLYDRAADGSRAAAFRRAVVEVFLRIGMKTARVSFETAHDRDVWLSRRLITGDQAFVTKGAGVDLGRFHGGLRADPADRLSVLFAGRLLRSKGLDVVLRAGALLAGRSDIELLVAGFVERDDPDGVSVEEIEAAETVTFLGPVRDMPDLLARCGVVVLPSRYNEGVPRILIEAAACGCVPVATRFAGSEALIAEGETGFFLGEGSVEAQAARLADVSLELRRDDARRLAMGRRAAAFVRDNGFGARDVAAVFLAEYTA